MTVSSPLFETSQKETGVSDMGLEAGASAKPVVPTCGGAVGFTPGPWIKDGNGILRGPSGQYVGEWNSGIAGVQRTPEAEANGVLRNAAPVLYEAVSLFVEWLSQPPTSAINVADVKAIGESALKLARGEPSSVSETTPPQVGTASSP